MVEPMLGSYNGARKSQGTNGGAPEKKNEPGWGS
jgi:hypothetical protein